MDVGSINRTISEFRPQDRFSERVGGPRIEIIEAGPPAQSIDDLKPHYEQIMRRRSPVSSINGPSISRETFHLAAMSVAEEARGSPRTNPANLTLLYVTKDKYFEIQPDELIENGIGYIPNTLDVKI